MTTSSDQGFSFEEWKEARSSIRRFDEYLLNLRKYGFTLATILIGADAYLSIQEDVLPWAKAGAAIAVMLLIFALFLLDQHVKLLQETALGRSVELEKELRRDVKSMGISELRRKVTKSWQVTHGGTPTYILFVLVTGGLGITAVLTMAPGEPVSWGPLIVVILICLILSGVTPVYNWWASRKAADLLTPEGVKKQLAGVFTQLGNMLQEKDKKTRK